MANTPPELPPEMRKKIGDADLTSTLHISALRSVPDFLSENSLLDSLSTEEFNIVKVLDSKSAMLISLAGPGKGARFLLNSETTTIGRDPGSEIFLDDVTVSRKHCQIVRTVGTTGTKFEIEDLKSLNGTYVNAISKSNSVLNHGDEVQVGKYRLTFFGSILNSRVSEGE